MNKVKKTNIIFSSFFIIGLALFVYSDFRTSSCGYDCAIFTVSLGPATVVGWFLGIIIASISLLVLLFNFIKLKLKKYDKNT